MYRIGSERLTLSGLAYFIKFTFCCRKDYDHFNMGEPFFPEVEDIEADLKKHEQIWGLFDEFNKSLQEFSNEEWIVFRSKTYKFEEFLNNWGK